MDEEDFPTGMWDDFDGELIYMKYETGDYGTQIQIAIRPEDYEFAARDLEVVSIEDLAAAIEDDNFRDTGIYHSWLSLGKAEYTISDDGLTVKGPAPNRQSRAVQWILKLRKAAKVTPKSASLKEFIGAKCHFKSEKVTTTNPETKEKTERDVLWPAGKVKGSAIEVKKSEEESAPEVDTSEHLEAAKVLILETVGEAGSRGLKISALPTALLSKEEEADEAVIQVAMERGTATAMIEAEELVDDDGRLKLP